VPLVELPFNWYLNDFVYFQFILKPVAIPSRAATSHSST
jgi:hypothetical protein